MTSIEQEGDRQSRAAKNQSLFREINERITDLNDAFAPITDSADWVREYANEACVERVAMCSNEYEAVRADPRRFVVAPSEEHVWRDVEKVVTRRVRYWTVEKRGAAGELGEATDPPDNWRNSRAKGGT
jgi:hypothetical protein